VPNSVGRGVGRARRSGVAGRPHYLEECHGKFRAEGFVVLPRRWVVERTFGWLYRFRRLSKDYEVLPETSETWIYAAMVRTMPQRLARNAAVYL
jgi:transposase